MVSVTQQAKPAPVLSHPNQPDRRAHAYTVANTAAAAAKRALCTRAVRTKCERIFRQRISAGEHVCGHPTPHPPTTFLRSAMISWRPICMETRAA